MLLCMNDHIKDLLAQMAALEAQLRDAVRDQESRVFFQIKGKRVEFERSVRDAHRQLKTGWGAVGHFLACEVTLSQAQSERFTSFDRSVLRRP
jgi:hypothetical protein